MKPKQLPNPSIIAGDPEPIPEDTTQDGVQKRPNLPKNGLKKVLV